MPDLPTAFTDAIRDRYVVERGIGAGGMATVHLARDVRHNRYVAIKVLKPELAASLGAERFLKEIEIAARLTHPHIIPLHDSGQAAGFLYYVMPFIDGESLRTRLLRETRIDTAAALGIAEDVGDALSYAHRQGILHRDIKPENILFSEGHPMVADFGIARAVSTAGGANITRTGLALGTPGYMSPEQAAGDRELDARTDVYSLGCVLYEMLVGEPPGMWQTDESLRLGRFTDLPERHRARIREIGGPIERALVRALAIRTRDRFETVDAFLHALRAEEGAVRRYSDGEVEEIVRQAAEEQLAHPTEEGMSLRTVQQIADDVGISPERVERAARKLEVRERARPPAESGAAAFWLGSRTLIGYERVVDGEVTETAYEEIVDEIQATLSTVGQVGTLGRSLTWSTAHSGPGVGRALQVRVISRGGQTRIHVQERLGELAGSLFGGLMGGGGGGGLGLILGIGIGALGAGPEIGLLAVGWVGGVYALARTIYRAVSRKRRAELQRLSDRIAEIAAESARER
ncbi:MAG: protein kinase [Gemmatimonadales bacterium]|nr:protein kinase [Gemmatimonadales bacterium]NIR00091.1 protein kinase [Gemmatimonadales bacterium]